MIRLRTVSVLVLLAFPACTAEGLPASAPDLSTSMVESLPVFLNAQSWSQEGRLVTTEWLKLHIDFEDPDLVVIHVESRPEGCETGSRVSYVDGHIPTARQLRWEEIVETRNGVPDQMPPLESLTRLVRKLGIRSTDRVVLYDTGMGIEAARAFVTLDYLGLADRACLLDGQWKKWCLEQRTVSTTVVPVVASNVTPQIKRDVILSLEGLLTLQWLAGQSTVGLALVDARSFGEYVGEVPGEGIGRPGHIPGARSLCWIENLESAGNPALRPGEELRALYEAAGARRNRFLVAYGRTGVEASYTYFVGKLLGYPVRLYAGSFAEWSSKDNLPVRPGPMS